MTKQDKIYIAGHQGLVGSAIMRQLLLQGFTNLVIRTSLELDLRNQKAVADFFEQEKPDYVFLAAAKVGGIVANNAYGAEFIYDNMMIQCNVIHQSYNNGAKKLMFLGSSCIYPKFAPQPLKEKYLLSGLLEETNEPYAIAKIAGIKMCEAYRSQYGCNFISVMPTNLFGKNDNYDLNRSHVLPALLRKFITAKRNGDSSVTIWGSGSPRREFLHVDDLAEACLFLMQNYNDKDIVNIGVGKDISILELAQLLKRITNFEGEIIRDLSKPDGIAQKLLDVSKLNQLGWNAKISLEGGIQMVYNDIKEMIWE